MKVYSTLLLALLSVIGLQAQDKYTYYTDLSKVEDDQVSVSLFTPNISDKEVTFYMPKIIPGTYAIADYGRFVEEFKAFDSKGKELKVSRENVNAWVIKKANKLHRISYRVADSFDYEGDGPEIFQPAGTNIEADKNFIINNSGFFGYFDGMKDIPFDINIIRDKEQYGGTGLIRQSTSETLSANLGEDGMDVSEDTRVDKFIANNYDQLVDSPLMYAKPDTVILKVANTEVLIQVYSPNTTITAEQIASTLETTLDAQAKFLGGTLPVDKYAFIFYFTDQPVLSYGALEHSYSSVYFIPESTIDQMRQTLQDFAAHEFFHIITPLTIHSEEIHRFDFNNPKMSRHLWLYEGVTEYFAGIVQAQSGMISTQQYINMLRQKLLASTNSYNDSLAFTELSLGALDEHEDQYGNVYQKGALIGLCLDLKLRSLSDGEVGLRDVILQLSEKLGKGNYFNDEELFGIITDLTYPEIGEFLDMYVAGSTPIPYSEFFELAGISFDEEIMIENLTMGFGQPNIDVNMDDGTLLIKNEDQLNAFGKELGLKDGDVLLQMNDKDIPPIGPEIQGFITGIMGSLKAGEEFSITVKREGEDVRLAAENFPVGVSQPYILRPIEGASEKQLAIREAWLTSLSPK